MENDLRRERVKELKTLIPEFKAANRKCPELRGTFVYYVGNPCAKLMLIGEAPGDEEEKQREPFCGKPGELLRATLATVGLTSSKCYITNVVKYRPKVTDVMGTENRTPTREELKAFMPSLVREVGIIQPELILCLGGTAAKALTGDFDFKITQERGDYFTVKRLAVSVLATYHPSYVMRVGGERSKQYKDFLSDLKEAARIYDK